MLISGQKISKSPCFWFPHYSDLALRVVFASHAYSGRRRALPVSGVAFFDHPLDILSLEFSVLLFEPCFASLLEVSMRCLKGRISPLDSDNFSFPFF